LVRVGVHQHARPESISKRAPSTESMLLQVSRNDGAFSAREV
jgi:hypothetical protein